MSVLRVACYERVSTEEQVKFGYSIDTQIDDLTDYCSANKMKIVGHYTDEGISGAKPPMKRPALARLLEDVKAGKIDMVLFTKLDRWFRSVKEYFKVQETLEKHLVEWKAIYEDYDTTTANGRMAITIFLAINQNESEKGSERIGVVFSRKRQNREACFGGAIPPVGYMKQKDESGVMRLVKDPVLEPVINEFWKELKTNFNIKKAIRHVGNVCGVVRNEKSWYRIARSEFYYGSYRGYDNYCEPYVSKEEWDEIQRRTLGTRSPSGSRAYLFTGMMKCPICGHVLCSTYDTKTYKGVKREYRNYRCRYSQIHQCEFNRSLSELKIERYLLENLETMIRSHIAQIEIEKKSVKPKPKYNISAIKEKMRRLEVVYMAGNKSDAEYISESNELKALISQAEAEASPTGRDAAPFQKILLSDIRGIYSTFDQWEKRRFWQGLVKEIVLDGNQIKEVIFF